VIVPGEGATADLYRQFADVSTQAYDALTIPRSPTSLIRASGRLRADVEAFRSRIRELRPDLVVVATATLPAVQIAARREGVPVVLEASELLTSGRALPRRLAGQALVRRAGALADVVFACSKAVAAEYAGARAPVIVSYPPIDVASEGDGASFRARHGLPAEGPVVLAIGSITERRGHDVLVEAMSIVRRDHPAMCVIAGVPFPRPQDLEFDRRLRELAGQADGAVLLIGYEPRVGDAYAAADVVVNPRRDPEAFGRVPCEALAAGRPVVAARTGAVPEVLRDGVTALLVPPGDAAGLASAVNSLLADPELGRRLAQHGREDVLRRFSAAAARERFGAGLRLIATRDDGGNGRTGS
jgi:glycosyltransferase involved in cell wall biosynthesis